MLISLIVDVKCFFEPLTIQCDDVDYEEGWWTLKRRLVCTDSSGSLNVYHPDMEIGKVLNKYGVELEAKDLESIEALNIKYSLDMKFMPKGFLEKFPNLKALKIDNCGLIYVDKNSFKQFGSEFEVFDIYENKLTVLYADLFEFNPNLKFISFMGNPLMHIEMTLIDSLREMHSLEYFLLWECLCTNDSFQTHLGHNIHNFTWHLAKCNDTKAWIQNYFKLPNDTNSLERKINFLKMEMNGQKENLTSR